jgi:hypothetical protein
MVSREGLCTVDAWLSVISSRAEKRVTKDGVLPLRLDLADRGPFKLDFCEARLAVGAPDVAPALMRAASRLVSMPLKVATKLYFVSTFTTSNVNNFGTNI